MVTPALVVLALSSAIIASALADSLPQEFADKFGAKCLNGDPPQFELTLNSSSNGWILFLEGGGWCNGATENATLRSCAKRAGFVWPPSASDANGANGADEELPGLAPYAADIGGVMSQNETLNPDFYSWNKVFIRYCDGASFGGGRVDPVPVSTRSGAPAQMWFRGRANFDAVISFLMTNTTIGMGNAKEVILSGGSAGGLAVFYNLDHLRTLLPADVALTGFPDAGFFMDVKDVYGHYTYRQNFIGADPVWNVTGSGGTNLKCLAANMGQEWKCLMAQYIMPHVTTPIYVLNAAYDAYQMGAILFTPCIPSPLKTCTASQNATMKAFRDNFVATISVVTAGKPANGVYLDGCYVHEQNVNYCSNQGMPNCVGWSPQEPGSIKWGYSTAIKIPDGRVLTPQQAFGAYYKGDKEAAVAIDQYDFFSNPTCHYLGKPV